jgi:hypothetical protein
METLFFHSAPAKKRRVTVAAIVTESGTIYVGVSKCSALDQFSRKKGRSIASVRASSKKGRYAMYNVDDVPKDATIGFWFKGIAQEIVKDVLKNASPLPKSMPKALARLKLVTTPSQEE